MAGHERTTLSTLCVQSSNGNLIIQKSNLMNSVNKLFNGKKSSTQLQYVCQSQGQMSKRYQNNQQARR